VGEVGGVEGSELEVLDSLEAESALGLQLLLLNFGRWMYVGRVGLFMQGQG
jgi:hypothetical protein